MLGAVVEVVLEALWVDVLELAVADSVPDSIFNGDITLSNT